MWGCLWVWGLGLGLRSGVEDPLLMVYGWWGSFLLPKNSDIYLLVYLGNHFQLFSLFKHSLTVLFILTVLIAMFTDSQICTLWSSLCLETQILVPNLCTQCPLDISICVSSWYLKLNVPQNKAHSSVSFAVPHSLILCSRPSWLWRGPAYAVLPGRNSL